MKIMLWLLLLLSVEAQAAQRLIVAPSGSVPGPE